MSHFTTVQTKITDLESLEKSLMKLDFRVIYEARVRGWNGVQQDAPLIARFEDYMNCPFDIGFVPNQETKTYDMVADWWAIKDKIGFDEDVLSKRIMQQYAYYKVIKEVQSKGFMVSEEKVDKDQSIRLLVRKW